MKTALPTNDAELQAAFKAISESKHLSAPIVEISKLVSNSRLTQKTIQEVIDTYKLDDIITLKENLLDILISYIHFILDDHIISENERYNFEILKRYFRIKEGDFFRYRKKEIGEILYRQFKMIYLDNQVTTEEAIHSVFLQELFDLSYDQLEYFKGKEISQAIKRGADIFDLDTVLPIDAQNEEE